MSLLFLQKRVNKYCIIFIMLSFSNCLRANDSISKNEFLKHCKKSDAYLLYSYTDVSYVELWSRYKRQTSVSTKLVVNNNSGVDNFAFLNLTQNISNNLKEIQFKALKADGTVIELDSSLVFQRKSKDKKFGSINYPIPGVEPGDTIETYYVYTEYLRNYELKDFVNLYSNVPSLKTEYTVKCEPKFLVRYKSYNNFPEPEVISNDTLIYCVFKMKNIKGLSENQNTCLPCELPYLYYSIENEKSRIRTWMDVYNQEFNVLTQPISFDYEKSSYYRRWKRRVIGEAKDSTKYYKFKLLHNDILNNVKMEPAKMDELIKSSGYFLKEKRFNPFSIKRLYRQLLEDLEIEYSAVFSRSKRSGPIDPYYIRKGEYDHIFFAYENGNGSINLLYPHEAYYKYQINEIPTSIYNTESIIAKPYLTEKIKKSDKFINYDLELAEVDSVTVRTMKLPGMSVDHNYIKQIYYSNIDLKEKNPTFKYRFSVSGGLSTELRSFYDLLNQNKEVSDFYDALAQFEGNKTEMQIDTIISIKFKNTTPFNYSVTAEGTLKEALNFLNDSILSISFENLINHNQIESELDSIDLNYYLDYKYTDQCMIILKFPCEIEVLGFDSNKMDFKNDYGEYLFNLKISSNKNELRLISHYKIIKEMIPKDEYKQLKKINKLVKEIKNKRLIIKLKGS